MLIDKPLNADCLFKDEETKSYINDIFETINRLREANSLYESRRDEKSVSDGAVTVCLSGAWGTGKSSYLRGLQKKFEDEGSKTLFFEAWRYPEELDIFLALLEELYGILEHQGARRVMRSLIKTLGVATLVGTDALLKVHLRLGIDDIEKGFKIVEKRIRSVTTKTKQNHDRLKRVLNRLGSSETPFVLLVDDLDRLVPQKAFNLLERLRFYFSGPNVVIIMAINDEVINRYVHQHHDIEDLTQLNEAFIDKIFHYRFELPYSPLNALHLRGIRKCLEDLVEGEVVDLKVVLKDLKNHLLSYELRLPHRKWINVLNRIEAGLLTFKDGDISSQLRRLAPLALLKELLPEFNYLYRKHEDALLDMNSPHVVEVKNNLEKKGKSYESDLFDLFMKKLTEIVTEEGKKEL